MSQEIKFTEQEVAEIRMLQGKYQQRIIEFGNFKMERMHLLKLVKDLEDRETTAEEDFANLQKMETELLEKLTKKYGEGQLNLEDGTFIPTSSPPVSS